MAWYDKAWDYAKDSFTDNPTDWLNVGANIGSSLLSYNAADKAAQSNLQAGQAAAAAAEFKPYAITSGLGTSFFDPSSQKAGYELDPTLAAFRNTLYQGGANFLGQVQEDPMVAAQNYYNQQQGLLAGGREAEDIALRNQQINQGRIGLGLSGASQGVGGGGYLNPDQFSLASRRDLQNQQIAASSTQMGQADIDRAISRGTGLMQAGLGVEQQGLTPLTIGADIGNRAATAGAQQGANLLAGANAASQANLAGSLGAAGMLSNMFKPSTGYKFNPETGQRIA